MLRETVCCIALLLACGVASAEGEQPEDDGDKLLSGMSIVGNDEAPKSLVIVPWKSSEPGGRLEVANMLDAGRGPVDRDVFARELSYYQIREGTAAAPAGQGP